MRGTGVKRTGLAIAAAVLLLAVAPRGYAEQLTTVGIVNINRIYNAFYRDSQAVRDLERLRNEYQAEIDSQVRQLESLRSQRSRMAQSGSQTLLEQLDQQILTATRFLEDLTRRRRQQLEQRQAELVSNEFLAQLQQAIQFVAESQGFTVILRSDTAGLQWWTQEVDISERVLERLVQVGAR